MVVWSSHARRLQVSTHMHVYIYNIREDAKQQRAHCKSIRGVMGNARSQSLNAAQGLGRRGGGELSRAHCRPARRAQMLNERERKREVMERHYAIRERERKWKDVNTEELEVDVRGYESLRPGRETNE